MQFLELQLLVSTGRHLLILNLWMLLSFAFRLWELTFQVTCRRHTEFSSHGLSSPQYLKNFFFPLMAFNVQFSCSVTYTWWFVHSGWLLIAEVKSRFDPTSGGADPNNFTKAVCELGFGSVSKVCSCYFPNQVLLRIDTSIDADRFFSHSGLL